MSIGKIVFVQNGVRAMIRALTKGPVGPGKKFGGVS